MGKKKHKKHGKHEGGHDTAHGTDHGPIPAPLAGIAAAAVHQLQSPATRAMLASGLRAAADALSRPAPGASPVPPVAPVPPPPGPAAGAAPQGTTKAPDTQAIAGAIEDAAKLVLGRLFAGKKG